MTFSEEFFNNEYSFYDIFHHSQSFQIDESIQKENNEDEEEQKEENDLNKGVK